MIVVEHSVREKLVTAHTREDPLCWSLEVMEVERAEGKRGTFDKRARL